MKQRLLAILLALALLVPAPALAASDLAEAFAAAGIELPDYSDSIDSLGAQIRAAYGTARDAQGRFRPGAFVVSCINSGGRIIEKSANPYLMPSDPDAKLAFMLAEGLMQYALDGKLSLSMPGGDAQSVTRYDFAVDAGLDNDKCFAVDGNLAISESYGSASDDFFLRYNQDTGAMRIKPPFGDESVIEEQDASLPDPMRILQQSMKDDAGAWAEAIDQLYIHLAAQPELATLLNWLCEGAAEPEHWSLEKAELAPMLRRLLTELAMDAQFTEALAQTKLLEAIYAGDDTAPIDLANLSQGMRGTVISVGLCGLANAIDTSGDPFQGAQFGARLDRGALRIYGRTVADPADPSRFDDTFELVLRCGADEQFLQASWGDRYTAYNLNTSKGEGRCDITFQTVDRSSGASGGAMRLSFTPTRARMTYCDLSFDAPQLAELDLRWKKGGAWTLTGSASEGSEQLYTLEGAGDLTGGSAKGTALVDCGIPSWRLNYQNGGAQFTASASLVEDGQDAGPPIAITATRHEHGFDVQTSLLGTPASLSWGNDGKNVRFQLNVQTWTDPINLFFRSTESGEGARTTVASLSAEALSENPCTLQMRTEPLGGGDYQYEIELELDGVKVRIDGRDHIKKDLQQPAPLTLDQQGTIRITVGDETVTAEYELHHRFEVKERKHRDPVAGDPVEASEPAPTEVPGVDEQATSFVPAVTESPAEESMPAATRRPVRHVK